MNKTRTGGYVGLLALLIVVAIAAFLMFKQYESLGYLSPRSQIILPEGATSTRSLTPIDQARQVKGVLESQDLNRLKESTLIK